jgi:uncharacterized membrane-anchored protein
MDKKKFIIPLFILVALAQFYVPAKMILDVREILDSGKEYKFKLRPVDPIDPFRGKYIRLFYEENYFFIREGQQWIPGENVYALLTRDINGYAKIRAISKAKPNETEDFVKVNVTAASFNSKEKRTEINFTYPFDRYYMEEAKAPAAERLNRGPFRGTNRIAYGLVNVRNGEAVLKDVLIDGISINELVKDPKNQNLR